jgi:competence protein ComEA
MKPRLMHLASGVLLLAMGFVAPAQAPSNTSSDGKVPPTADTSPVPTPSEPLDINAATAEQLDRLPDVGGAYTRRIMEGRPYRSKMELLERRIIPASVYKRIQRLITVKQNMQSATK